MLVPPIVCSTIINQPFWGIPIYGIPQPMPPRSPVDIPSVDPRRSERTAEVQLLGQLADCSLPPGGTASSNGVTPEMGLPVTPKWMAVING